MKQNQAQLNAKIDTVLIDPISGELLVGNISVPRYIVQYLKS